MFKSNIYIRNVLNTILIHDQVTKGIIQLHTHTHTHTHNYMNI